MTLDTRVRLVELIELSAEQAPPPLTAAEQAWLDAFRARDRRSVVAPCGSPAAGEEPIARGAARGRSPVVDAFSLRTDARTGGAVRGPRAAVRASPWLLFAYGCVVTLSLCLAYG